MQSGRPAPSEKSLGQGLLKGLGVRELVADDEDGTYRVVYTVRLRGAVYVLHAFNKKSKHAIATPRHELEVIRSRYALAVRIDQEAAAG